MMNGRVYTDLFTVYIARIRRQSELVDWVVEKHFNKNRFCVALKGVELMGAQNILDMIRLSENNTNVLLADIYPSMWNEAHESVNKVYSDMMTYMKGEENMDLKESVRALFDALFPLVYHHNINPKLQELSADYKECMQETQDEIRPFGDVARRLGLHVSKSLQAARVFVQALTLGMKAMNLTDYVVLTPECQRALLRLTHCPHCQGLVSAKPCTGYCLNVMHGCLSGVAEMEQPWNDFISSLETLVNGMKGAYNVEEVTASLDSKISDAIMHAMDNGPEISKKENVFDRFIKERIKWKS
uniref:Glypican-5 n=1 Tax=Strigamia maritima TaxID=126957 RepID=T1JIS7_STRMM